MGKRFFSGTELFEYEVMMQQLPHACNLGKCDKKLKSRYFRMMERLISEKGLEPLKNRVMRGIKSMLFDEFCFVNTEHEYAFGAVYGKYVTSEKGSIDNNILAIIYLLSSNKSLSKTLCEYTRNKMYVLPEKISAVGEDGYNIYQMAKRILGDESAVTDEDMLEPGIIDDRILCIMVNAIFLQTFGLKGLFEDNSREKQPYINIPRYHRNKYRTYNYKNQTVRIKM